MLILQGPTHVIVVKNILQVSLNLNVVNALVREKVAQHFWGAKPDVVYVFGGDTEKGAARLT